MTPSSSCSVDDAFREYQRTRSPASLATVYDRTSVRLLAVAMHLCATAAEAEDAVQDTFLIALEHPERWDSTRPVEPWLLGILGNRLRHARRQARRVPDADRLAWARPEIDPAAEIEGDELLAAVEDAIEHVAQPYRSVVLLRIRNGLSPGDIAIALDRNPSTVRAQLTRGLQMLRKLLPAGFAAGLVVSMTAGRGLAAVRETVVARAESAHRAFRWQQRIEFARRAARPLVGVGVAAVLVVLASVWPTRGDELAEPSTAAAAVDREPRFETAEPTPVGIDAPGPAATRVDAALRGAVRLRVRHRGSPAPGVALALTQLDDPSGVIVHRRSSSIFGDYEIAEPSTRGRTTRSLVAASDSDGWCTFSALEPGPWLIVAPERYGMVDVEPGETKIGEIDLVGPICVVNGVVLDRWGAPIDGAEIWSCHRRDAGIATEVARTDPSGRFTVVAAGFTTVGARAEGYAPVSIALTAADGLARDVVIRLEHPSGGVRGSVVDPDGEPISHAVVQIGHSAEIPDRDRELPGARSAPFRVHTDAAGTFSAGSVMPGSVWTEACAPGFGTGGAWVTVGTGETAATRIVLAPAVTVAGRATNAAGEPLAGVRVHCGIARSLGFVAAATDAQGRFRLEGVPARRVLVRASDFDGAAASTIVEGQPGDTLTWNPVLDTANLEVSGRVVLPDGSPLAGGWVARFTKAVAHGPVGRTDAAGRFTCRIPDREAEFLTQIAFFERDPDRGDGVARDFPLAVTSLLPAGTHDLVVRVPASRYPAGRLTGRIVDEQGAPPSEPVVLHDLEIDWRRRLQFTPLGSDGSFDAGPIPPSRYRIVSQLETYEVRAGARTDAGTLRCAPVESEPPPGGVECELVFLHPRDGTPCSTIAIEIHSEERGLFESAVEGSSSTGWWRKRIELPPGRYRVDARTPTGLAGTVDLLVEAQKPPARAVLVPMLRG